MGNNDDSTDTRFIVEIGSHRFDPKEEASRARRRADSDRKRLAAALDVSPEGIPDNERELWIVQFTQAPDIELIDRFRDQYGLSLTGGLSSLTFIELMTRATAQGLRREVLVRACIPYWSELKLARSSLSPPKEIAAERLLTLGLVHDETEDLHQKLDLMGCIPVGPATSYSGGFLLRVRLREGGDPKNLLLINEVEWVEDVPAFRPANASSSAVVQGGGGGGARPIWDKGLHGEDQVIGILDVGIPDMLHNFFIDHDPPGLTHRKVLAVLPDLDGVVSSHPTMVSGCAAGDDFNAGGSHPDRGGAWAAKLVCIDFNRSGEKVDDELKAAFAKGASIVNVSAADAAADGTKPAPYTANAAAFDHELWKNEYLMVVSAVPNSCGSLQDYGGAPENAKNPLGVAGTRDVPNQNSFHTGRPGTADGRRKPELVAVGQSVATSDLTRPTANSPFNRSAITTVPCGTSLAAPHVSAAAALVRQYFIEGWYPTGKASPNRVTPSGALLKAVLLNATVDMPGAGYPKVREGWGRLELDKTLHFDGDKILLQVKDVPHIYGHDTSVPARAKTFFVNVPNDAKSMKVTLVFNDPAGAVGANDPTVNQLDLVLMEPMRSRWDGWEVGYFGNDFGANKLTVRRGLLGTIFPPDRVELKNNVRQVVVNAPGAGRWGLAVFCHRFDKANTPGEWRSNRKAQGYAWVARVDLK